LQDEGTNFYTIKNNWGKRSGKDGYENVMRPSSLNGKPEADKYLLYDIWYPTNQKQRKKMLPTRESWRRRLPDNYVSECWWFDILILCECRRKMLSTRESWRKMLPTRKAEEEV